MSSGRWLSNFCKISHYYFKWWTSASFFGSNGFL